MDSTRKIKPTVKDVENWCNSVGAVYYFYLGHNIKLKGIRNLRDENDLTSLLENAKILYDRHIINKKYE